MLPLAEDGELVVELTHNHWGYHYTHANCIAIRTEYDVDELTEVAEAIDRFETALSGDIRSVCHQAEQDGYALLHDAFNPEEHERILYRRSSKHFQLCVEAKPSDHICFFGSTQDTDALLDRLLAGYARLLGIMASVTELDTELDTEVELSRGYDTLVIAREARGWQWFPGALRRELMTEARADIEQRLRHYRSFWGDKQAA